MKANSKLAPLLLLSACHLTAGPFVPPGAHRCDSDAQCDEHHVCRFPSAGTRAICMPGENPIDAWGGR
jgi:hypothetical protein